MIEPLREDQLAVLFATQVAFKRGVKRVCIQAQCGFGKTHVGCGIAQRANTRGTSTLIIAHRRRLIQQWSERLERFDVPHGIIMANATEDLVKRHRTGSRVQVASKDTLISRANREGLPLANLVIIDETQNILGREFTNLINNYPDAYWLGLTATPVGGDGRGLGGYFDELVCAPPSSKLIEAGHIVPFRVYAALEMKDVRKSGGRVRPAGDPVSQWQRHAQDKPTVMFAPRVTDSKEVVESFVRAGIPAVHIDAHSTEAERDDAAVGLESGAIKVVSQVGLWTEGVDVPCVAVVQLLAKCGSLVKFVQAVWRAGRSFPGKEYATVIDHTGAVFEHGFPDDDLEWSLTPGAALKKASKGGDADDERANPFICVNCGLCYTGRITCPGCDCPLAVNRKMYQPELFAHLVEVDRDFTERKETESLQRQWTSLLFQFARTNKTLKAAVAVFRVRTGRWPDEAGCSPLYDRAQMPDLVIDVFPQFGKQMKKQAARLESGTGLFV